MNKWLLVIMANINEPFYSPLVYICNAIKLMIKPEKRHKYGELNKDVKFYVIHDLWGGWQANIIWL